MILYSYDSSIIIACGVSHLLQLQHPSGWGWDWEAAQRELQSPAHSPPYQHGWAVGLPTGTQTSIERAGQGSGCCACLAHLATCRKHMWSAISDGSKAVTDMKRGILVFIVPHACFPCRRCSYHCVILEHGSILTCPREWKECKRAR